MAMEGEQEKGSHGGGGGQHLLKSGGWRRTAAEGSAAGALSKAQRRSLSAICEAFLSSSSSPSSSSMPVGAEDASLLPAGAAAALRDFYMASGSDLPVLRQVEELLVRKMLPEAVLLIKLVLWMLDTRLGTLVLCGGPSLCLRRSRSFPYFRVSSFSEMPVAKREEVLHRWMRETFFVPIKLVAAIVKVLCCYAFFTVTDENGENKAWKAIGYSPPAPSISSSSSSSCNCKKQAERPLHKGIIEARHLITQQTVLLDKGFRLTMEKAEKGGGSIYRMDCDVVIVGSGAGGGVAAAVLAASGYKVVVIEKGDYFTKEDYTSLEGPSMEQMYEGGGIFPTQDGKMMILAGATVGGGTAINWSACIRTPDHVLAEWADEHHLPIFTSPEFAAAMDAVFERLGVTHGCEEEGLQNQVLRNGCRKLGLPVEHAPRNSPEDHYCGSCCFGCRSGSKRGADTTWLVDAVSSGAVIVTGCRAERFLLEENDPGRRKKKRCSGVVAIIAGGAKLHIRSRFAAISACGSLSTPPLLITSGLKNPNIGRNLRLHPVTFAWGYFPPESSIVADELKGSAFEGGIITSMHRMPDPSGYGAIVQTPVMFPGTFTALFPWISSEDMKGRMMKYGRTVHLFALARDRGSGGTVRSSGRVSYGFDEEDKRVLTAGLRRAVRILAAAGAEEVGTHRSDGQRMVIRRGAGAGERELEEFVEGVEATEGPATRKEKWSVYASAHQMGSCRMAASEEGGGVDAAAESWEAEGLFVCDGSLLPTAVGVNPMVTIQALAYCVSRGIAERLGR